MTRPFGRKLKSPVQSLLLMTFAIVVFGRNANATIRYTISLAHPEQHIFHVTMQVPNAGRELVVAIPAWNATYQIRDFACRVTDVRAQVTDTNVNSALHIEKLDKETWRISGSAAKTQAGLGDVTIQYDDYWDDPGPFASQLNSHHAFLNLAEVLFYIPTRRDEKSEVNYTNLPPNWGVAQQLPALINVGSPIIIRSGFSGPSSVMPPYDPDVSFAAPSYDALVDAPAEIGEYKEFSFAEGEAHFRVVVDGDNWNESSLRDGLQKIVTYETGMMRDVPFREYTFFFHFGFGAAGGGGMEHANCTAIGAASGEAAPDIAAHEFFHLWNVKRIRPQTLQPVDYSKEMWTRALWFAEGVTSTYGAFTMERSGLWSREQFYGDLAQQFTELEGRPAHLAQSAEESSLDTWLDKYNYYDQPQVSISYYNKGQILGVMLDLAIRDAADNHKSLDDVMRAMNRDYAQRGRFYDDSKGVEQEVEAIAGRSFKEFFADYVAGTKEIPYNDFLRAAGLQAEVRQQSVADWGFQIERGANGAPTIESVATGSGAEKAGLRSGDVILQIEGQPFGRSAMRVLYQHHPGDTVNIRIERDGAPMSISFALAERLMQTYSVSEIPNATERQKRIREGLLRGTTN
jgi:predicted metalloprotease with PDZ domain